MQPRVNVKKGTPDISRIARYIRRSTFTGSRIAIPHKNDKITMIDNPMTSCKIGIFRALIKWQAMNNLTKAEQAVIFITSLSGGEYLCILRARYYQLYGYTHLQGNLHKKLISTES